MRSWLQRSKSAKHPAIQTPKYKAQQLRRFSESEGDVLQNWSLLPTLFEEWDDDKSGSIDKKELLFGVGMFCKSNNIYFSRERTYEIMASVDVNDDQALDQKEFTTFLIDFSRSVDVSLFELVHFMMAFLAEREEWNMDDFSDQTSGKEIARSIGGETLANFWGIVQTNLSQELR